MIFDGRLNGDVWAFWVAQKALKPHLAATVLALLACPIGSAAVERALRKIKKTSLYKERGATTPQKKAMLDFVYVNAPLQLTQLERKREREDV